MVIKRLLQGLKIAYCIFAHGFSKEFLLEDLQISTICLSEIYLRLFCSLWWLQIKFNRLCLVRANNLLNNKKSDVGICYKQSVGFWSAPVSNWKYYLLIEVSIQEENKNDISVHSCLYPRSILPRHHNCYHQNVFWFW